MNNGEMRRRLTRHAARACFQTIVGVTLALVGASPAWGASGGVSITTQPASQPAFDPSIPDYVTRCGDTGALGVSVTDTAGAPVSVDQQPARTSNSSYTVPLLSGQRFTIAIGAGSTAQTYSVRCLPPDFPGYSAQLFGQPQAAYYVLTPGSSLTGPGPPYVVLFDSDGVPVWWYRQPDGTPINASLLSNGDLAWFVEAGVPETLGYPGAVHLEEHELNGALVRTLQTVSTPTDFHEGYELPNGDFLITSYALRTGVDLTSLGFSASSSVLDGTFQEIRPDGSLAYSWSSVGNVAPTENVNWRAVWLTYPGSSSPVWDMQHINSVEPDGDGFLISMRQTDAIYLVRASDGAIEWKLGGTPTPQSLTITNGPISFSGQHDARVLPDGTISVHDNGTIAGGPPRVLRFSVNTTNRTATLIQTITDPTVTTSACCGSARMLPGGDWVINWGGTQVTDELSSDGSPVLRLTLAAPYFSYRTIPILPGQLSLSALESGMDAMNPRTPPTPPTPPVTNGGGVPRAASVRSLRVLPAKFVIVGRLVRGQCVAATRANRKHQRCTRHVSLRVLFTLDGSAEVQFVVRRAVTGRMTGTRCRRTTRSNQRARRCMFLIPVAGSFKRRGVGGSNQFRWAAAVGTRWLGPGSYRLTASPIPSGAARASATTAFALAT
jgi:hypothetical protein